MTNRSNASAKANPAPRGFWCPNLNVPRNRRQCVSPSIVEGMNHGTEARFHERSGDNSR